VSFIDNAYIDGEFNDAKINEMLGIMEGRGREHERVEDTDIADIMKQFEVAREARDDPQAVEQIYEDLNKTMEAKRTVKENPQANDEL
jgi:hypothetical protein